ncbi:hypothetical protein WA026_010762 [Henosepilachna vigintioctopunctata]|uniref:Uncharacterized protein n=1 Tax=Henosepilachna vigintioctopunctata TaxID=420089 RepID=A0AAW1UWI6_9CUCU
MYRYPIKNILWDIGLRTLPNGYPWNYPTDCVISIRRLKVSGTVIPLVTHPREPRRLPQPPRTYRYTHKPDVFRKTIGVSFVRRLAMEKSKKAQASFRCYSICYCVIGEGRWERRKPLKMRFCIVCEG